MKELTSLELGYVENLWSIDTSYIKKLPNLQNLHFYNRNETDSQKDLNVINDIQNALPNCDVYY